MTLRHSNSKQAADPNNRSISLSKKKSFKVFHTSGVICPLTICVFFLSFPQFLLLLLSHSFLLPERNNPQIVDLKCGKATNIQLFQLQLTPPPQHLLEGFFLSSSSSSSTFSAEELAESTCHKAVKVLSRQGAPDAVMNLIHLFILSYLSQ